MRKANSSSSAMTAVVSQGVVVLPKWRMRVGRVSSVSCSVCCCQRSSKEFKEDAVSRRARGGMCSSISSNEKIAVIVV